MNIPKSHSVPAIIISDYDSNAEDPFLKLKSAEAKNKIQNKIITSPTNSFEEKPQVEIKKPLTKTKVGNYFISLHLMIKVFLFSIRPGLKVSRMNPHLLALLLHQQQQSRRAEKKLRPASTKSDPIQNFRKVFKIPLWQKKNYAKLLVKMLFK